jgi:mannose-6-phosphate isomerase-like protein (cupin superfamily)
MTNKAFINKPAPVNTRAIPGDTFSFLIRGTETSNRLSLVKIEVQHGNEPPAHVHTREDEYYYILNGSIKFTVGNEILLAKEGDTVFLPMNVMHAFEVQNEKAEVLMWMTPGSLDQWFWDNSLPAPDMKPLPLLQGPPPAEAIEHFVKTLGDYGVLM